MLNPKAIVFYMAFFPLFVNPAEHQGLITFAVMAATIAALTLAYGVVIVVSAHLLAKRAIEKGVAFVPGAPFFANNPDNSTMSPRKT